MTDWPVKTLGELFEFKNGRGFKKTEWSTAGLPIIRIQNLNSDSASYNYFSGTFDEGILVEPGDLLFSWSGSIGTSFGPHIWHRSSGLLNQHIFKVNPKVPIDTDYAHYCLRAITAEIERSVNGAVGLVHITKEKLNKFKIPMPPLEEQKRIVELLDAATARVTELTTCYEQARTHANNLFASALRDALESGQSAPLRTLDELCEEGIVKLGRGNIISKKDIAVKPGSYPIYSSARENEGKFGEYGDYMFDEEMITWSIDGGGRLFYRPKHKFSVTNVGGTLRVLDPRLLDIQYLHRVLQNLHSQRVFDWVFKAHPSVIRKVYDAIPMPPLAEQKRIVVRLDSMRAKTSEMVAAYDAKLMAAKDLRQSILEAAFAGEL